MERMRSQITSSQNEFPSQGGWAHTKIQDEEFRHKSSFKPDEVVWTPNQVAILDASLWRYSGHVKLGGNSLADQIMLKGLYIPSGLGEGHLGYLAQPITTPTQTWISGGKWMGGCWLVWSIQHFSPKQDIYLKDCLKTFAVIIQGPGRMNLNVFGYFPSSLRQNFPLHTKKI